MTLNQLADMRRKNQQPKFGVIISMVGPLDFYNAIIEVSPPYLEYDFRPLLNLDVEIAHAHETQPSQVIRLADELLKVSPRTLNAWNAKTGVLTTISHNNKKSFFNYRGLTYACR